MRCSSLLREIRLKKSIPARVDLVLEGTLVKARWRLDSGIYDQLWEGAIYNPMVQRRRCSGLPARRREDREARAVSPVDDPEEK
jgi:hypothetical protein